MRDHGNCKAGSGCQCSHDPEEVKAARAALKAAKGNDRINASKSGKGNRDKKNKEKDTPKSQKPCPFHVKGFC